MQKTRRNRPPQVEALESLTLLSGVIAALDAPKVPAAVSFCR